MQSIANPVALELSRKTQDAVWPDDVVRGAMTREEELQDLAEYIGQMLQRESAKVAAKVAAEAAAEAAKEVALATVATSENMIIAAIRRNFPTDIIEALVEEANIPDTRLAELKQQYA